jgi:hypothetical protein
VDGLPGWLFQLLLALLLKSCGDLVWLGLLRLIE